MISSPLFRSGAALAAACVCWFGPGSASLHAQGSLTPPGAPAPTMKSLDQIEARTPVQTLSGDSTDQYVISAPGAYYLTGNITGVSGKNGIYIYSSNVTLDLNGFTMTGVTGALSAILGPGFITNNIAVRNGAITNWPGSGISAVDGTATIVEKLTISACPGGAVRLGQQTLVRDCIMDNCGSTSNAVLSSQANSILTNCVVHGYPAANGDGIQVDYGSLVEGCTSTENGGSGIVANGTGVRIHNCNCFGNMTDGIRGNNYCDISDCTVSLNGTSANAATSAGIHLPSANGGNERIDHCYSTNNRGRGIAVDGTSTNCVVTRNTSTSNGGANYAIATGNRAALIVTYSASTGYTSGDPLVNVQ